MRAARPPPSSGQDDAPAGSGAHSLPMATMQTKPSRAKAATRNGWVTFAGTYLLIAGAFNAIWGIAALTKKSHFIENGLVWSSLSFWGWIALIAAAAQAIAAVLVFQRRMSGMIVALVVASVSMIANFAMLGAYPLWSIATITCNILVVWAVTAHGDQEL